MSRQDIFCAIDEERERQISKWGAQRAADNPWLAILVEEVGEVAQEKCREYIGNDVTENLKAELIQVATVAVAWLEELQ